MRGNDALQQFFIPVWAAQLIVQNFHPHLSDRDVVVEPSCGDGRFLMAIPRHVEAFGVEIDPEMAARARENSGRTVITGDFATVDFPKRPTVVIGNPPFKLAVVDAFLDRCYEEMDYGGTISMVLPCFAFQTASRVVDYSKRFSLSQAMLPRNLFEGLSKPLMYATFKKDRVTVMSGLFLYAETDAVNSVKKGYRTLFVGNKSRASLWGELLEQALLKLGGEADLDSIYGEIESKRPTANPFWREQLRKVAGRHLVRTGRGRYALHAAKAA